jgi:hypothetical protein
MNRIMPRFASQPTKPIPQVEQVLRSDKKLRADADAALRDIAFVLSLSRRVKESILQERQLSPA